MRRRYITTGVTTGKFEPGCINEDAVMVRHDSFAVSDGAGGGGLFADLWSQYLVDNLPQKPICNADELDDWIAQIWQEFYNSCEEKAKLLGAMSLEKFYDEGSFATLVAVWRTAPTSCQWISFGDSVAFHYNYRTKLFEHSFTALGDFDYPPYLINCKDELNKQGFRNGTFNVDDDSVVFAASDALSHYIMMMYEVSRKEEFNDDIEQALAHHSKNENYIRTALSMDKVDFTSKVIAKLKKYVREENRFKSYVQTLERQGLLAHDDYSLAFMWLPKRAQR